MSKPEWEKQMEDALEKSWEIVQKVFGDKATPEIALEIYGTVVGNQFADRLEIEEKAKALAKKAPVRRDVS